MSVKDNWKYCLLIGVGLFIAIQQSSCFNRVLDTGTYRQCLNATREPSKCRELLP